MWISVAEFDAFLALCRAFVPGAGSAVMAVFLVPKSARYVTPRVTLWHSRGGRNRSTMHELAPVPKPDE